MKIYTRIVMDWDGEVIACEGYDYEGPVAACGGGGGKGSTPAVPEATPTPEPTKEPESKVEAKKTEYQKQAATAGGLSNTNVTKGDLAAVAPTTTKPGLFANTTSDKKSLMGQ